MRTKQAIATNSGNRSTVIYPKELAAPDHELKNPPPVAGLKVLAALIDAAGDAVTLDQHHELSAAALRAVPGISGYSVDALNDLLETLMAAQIKLHDPERRRYSFGPILAHAVVGYAQDSTVQSCRFQFGPAFREMVEQSDIYAILDRATLYALSSRYAILLYQFLSTHWRKKHTSSIELTLDDLRRIMAVEKGKYPEFKHLNDRTIKPSLKVISDLSPWTLTAQQLTTGQGRKRSVDRIRITWEPKKPLAAPAPKPGHPPRLVAQSSAFPETGGIAYSPNWKELKRAAGCNKDDNLIASDFRRFCREKGIALTAPNIEKVFSGFCAKVGKI